MNMTLIDPSRWNARAREARRIDGLIAEDAWNDPEAVDIRRQHAMMRVKRDLISAVGSAAFAMQSATTARNQARARLSNAEDNRYSSAATIMQGELDVRRFNRMFAEAEVAHAAAVETLAAAGFGTVEVAL